MSRQKISLPKYHQSKTMRSLNIPAMRDTLRHQGWKRFTHSYIVPLPFLIPKKELMIDTKRHIVTIVVDDIESAFTPVSELLHTYASHIHLRVGYPMKDKNVSVIFLIMEMDTDQMGAFSGKLGQIPSVKVKTITLKI